MWLIMSGIKELKPGNTNDRNFERTEWMEKQAAYLSKYFCCPPIPDTKPKGWFDKRPQWTIISNFCDYLHLTVIFFSSLPWIAGEIISHVWQETRAALKKKKKGVFLLN